MKITQLEKVHFIKVNEIKLIQDKLFSFFHFIYVVANSSELFCVPHLAILMGFYTILTYPF